MRRTPPTGSCGTTASPTSRRLRRLEVDSGRAAPLLLGTRTRPAAATRPSAALAKPVVLRADRSAGAAPAPLTYARGGTIGPVSEEQFRSLSLGREPRRHSRSALTGARRADAGRSLRGAATKWMPSAGLKRTGRTCSSSTWRTAFRRTRAIWPASGSCPHLRGEGIGRALIRCAESFAGELRRNASLLGVRAAQRRHARPVRGARVELPDARRLPSRGSAMLFRVRPRRRTSAKRLVRVHAPHGFSRRAQRRAVRATRRALACLRDWPRRNEHAHQAAASRCPPGVQGRLRGLRPERCPRAAPGAASNLFFWARFVLEEAEADHHRHHRLGRQVDRHRTSWPLS